MTDDTKVDNGVVGGESGSPNQGLSSANPESIPSQKVEDVNILKTELETLKKELRGLQSRQDKGTSEISEILAEFKKQQKSGLNEIDAELAAVNAIENRKKVARRDQALDLLIEKLNLNEVSEQLTGSKSNGTDDYAKVIKEFGANATDPDILLMLRESKNPTELAIKLGKRTQSPPPTQSQAAASVGQSVPTPDGNALIGEYTRQMQANRGKPSEIRRIKAEYAQKGVPVDQVAFT